MILDIFVVKGLSDYSTRFPCLWLAALCLEVFTDLQRTDALPLTFTALSLVWNEFVCMAVSDAAPGRHRHLETMLGD